MDPATNAAMLGELSAASSSNNNRKQRIPPYAKIPGSLGSSSGYAGDLESMNNSSRLPASIELTSRQKKRYAIIDIKPLYPQGKRPKPTKEELNYMAKNTKQDMEKGGLSSAPRRRPRVFPPQSKVDMSLVKLISSSEYDQEQRANVSPSTTTSDNYQAAALLDQFEQVAMEVAHCYRPVQFNDLRLKDFHEGVQKAKQHNNGLQQHQDTGFQSDSSSSSAATSSFTESDGGEDETMRNTSASRGASFLSASSSPSPTDEQNAFAPEDHNNNTDDGCQLMSLEQALSFSERPKYVFDNSMHSFTVYHTHFIILSSTTESLRSPRHRT